jgi:hypothetical protein
MVVAILGLFSERRVGEKRIRSGQNGTTQDELGYRQNRERA